MKKHQAIFEKIKTLLSEHFGDELCEYEDGTYLSIGDSGIWISVDEQDITIGYGFNHRHYHPEFDDLNEALDKFFNLLTGKKRTTEYYKGNYLYKVKAEIESDDEKFKVLSTTWTIFFPFWRKTQTKISIEQNLIDYKKIEKEILEITNYAKGIENADNEVA